ncbi:hypothetical protein GE061_017463 [Apolygus lucorum]|uniref:Reverse transcriptase domain-containing protein n=1 Tax=Apolygus lucorum TaxID=248454 RepID=A0A8S9XCH7_APOLU|nr:hypothetical protein GE061_017463 [Apolygus lucorum]
MKVFEMVLIDRMMKYFEDNQILGNAQYGFRRGRNTTQAVTELVLSCLHGLDEGQQAGALLFDMSKAFDLVDWRLLLVKFKLCGFDEGGILFFEQYLYGWQQYVVFNGEYSESGELSAGVRQGSILGPLCYIVFTNDLPLFVQHSFPKCVDAWVEVVLYADDISALITATSENAFHLASSIVRDLVSSCCRNNKLVLNADKTQSIRFVSRRGGDSDVTLLGLRLDESLTWSCHIRALSKSLSSTVCLLRRLSLSVSSSVLKSVYYALFESRLSTGSCCGETPVVLRGF